jgi:hypothetical protein
LAVNSRSCPAQVGHAEADLDEKLAIIALLMAA